MTKTASLDRLYERLTVEFPAVEAVPTSKPELNKPEPASEPHPIDLLKAGEAYDEAALFGAYTASGLHLEPDTFALYRIIGNDLVPRHARGQSRRNVEFALEHEPDLPDCRKFWIVNRIFDEIEKGKIIDLLERNGQAYIDIPFDREAYSAVDFDFAMLPKPDYLYDLNFARLKGSEQIISYLYRLKNCYLMNNNGARNVALAAGKRMAKWVLPWDGNCFLTQAAWDEIRTAVVRRPFLKYFAVPMQRVLNNDDLLSKQFKVDAAEEPQIIFRSDSTEVFDEAQPYGRRPKVELMWRLKMAGRWDTWRREDWDVSSQPVSPEAGQYGVAGWVARMFSGVPELERQDDKAINRRGRMRQLAIVQAINKADGRAFHDGQHGAMGVYGLPALARARRALIDAPQSGLGRLAARLVAEAEDGLNQGPWSVMDKTTLAPSGDKRDYWHPAPYWWPNPDTEDGLPYVKRDSVRRPGTELYAEGSDQYDRSHLQLMFDHSTRLALAWSLTGRRTFADHAAALIRAWFIDDATRMNPNLNYAQVRLGWNNNNGSPAGIIEFRDLYCLLDAARLLERAGALTAEDVSGFRTWLVAYACWLNTSTQGRKEWCSQNNHGVYYDLQVAAIHAWLGDEAAFGAVLLRAHTRVLAQIDETGWQAEEMARPISQHYVAFNLQGFINLFRLARGMGHDRGLLSPSVRQRLRAGLMWFLWRDMTKWPAKQIRPFNIDRVWPMVAGAIEIGAIEASDVPAAWRLNDLTQVNPLFDTDDSIPLYWNLSYG